MNVDKQYPIDLVPHRLSIGKSQIEAFAMMSGDFNPIHMDEAAARRLGMKGVVAHGSLSLNLIWESIESSFDLAENPRLRLDVRFKLPVYLDEIVESGGKRCSGTGDYEVWVSNQDGQRVIEGLLTVHT